MPLHAVVSSSAKHSHRLDIFQIAKRISMEKFRKVLGLESIKGTDGKILQEG